MPHTGIMWSGVVEDGVAGHPHGEGIGIDETDRSKVEAIGVLPYNFFVSVCCLQAAMLMAPVSLTP